VWFQSALFFVSEVGACFSQTAKPYRLAAVDRATRANRGLTRAFANGPLRGGKKISVVFE
jgi:hypothetical protein